MPIVSLSERPWFESYTDTIPKDMWEEAIRSCDFEVFKITKEEMREFIALNPKLTRFGLGLDDWFSEPKIHSDEFFSLLRDKQIFFRRVVEYSERQKQWIEEKFSGKICVFNEMHPMDEELFNELNITFINVFMPPIRFIKGSKIRAVYSNCPVVMGRIKKYEYPKLLCDMSAWWLGFSKRLSITKLKHSIMLKDNSCLLIGQCRFDYSKYDFEKQSFVQLGNYIEELKDITQRYEKVYYTKHPHEKGFYEQELLAGLGIEILDGVDTYSLMLSDEIKGVCALSSSMLTEARYFDKAEHRLFTNFVNIEKFTNITHRTLRSKSFWKHVLS